MSRGYGHMVDHTSTIAKFLDEAGKCVAVNQDMKNCGCRGTPLTTTVCEACFSAFWIGLRKSICDCLDDVSIDMGSLSGDVACLTDQVKTLTAENAQLRAVQQQTAREFVYVNGARGAAYDDGRFTAVSDALHSASRDDYNRVCAATARLMEAHEYLTEGARRIGAAILKHMSFPSGHVSTMSYRYISEITSVPETMIRDFLAELARHGFLIWKRADGGGPNCYTFPTAADLLERVREGDGHDSHRADSIQTVPVLRLAK